MKSFGLLTADQIECRVSMCKQNGLSLLLYKTARTDADILDKVIGPYNWQNDFKLVDGVLYGGIGIYDSGMERWIWKWDAGVESNTEAEKGRASDAFKRAGFKFGIGRELYSAPFIWIPDKYCKIEKTDRGGFKCNDRFSVKDIGYDEKEHINRLEITNGSKTVYTLGKSEQNPDPEVVPLKTAIKCVDCEKEIVTIKKRDGEMWNAPEIAAYSERRFGRVLCPDCQRKAKDNEN